MPHAERGVGVVWTRWLRLITTVQAVACATGDQSAARDRLDPRPVAEVFQRQRVIRLATSADDPVGRLLDLADWQGRLVVVDGIQANVKVFGQAGELILTIGRAGEGPGEFRRPCAATAVGDGTLAVLDCPAMRVSFFDSAGTFVRSWLVPGFGGQTLRTVRGGDQLLLATRRVELGASEGGEREAREYGLHLFALDGSLVASFGEQPQSQRRYERNFGGVAAEIVGHTVVSARILSDRITHRDLPSGREWSARIGMASYQEPELPTHEIRDRRELLSWAQLQIWVQDLVAVDSRRYLVRFVRWAPDWTPSYEYALATIDGEVLAVTAPTPIALRTARSDGVVLGSLMTDDGEVEISEFSVSER